LGEYEGQELKLKTGKYGPYVEWGENRENIRDWKRPLDELTLSDAIELLESKNQTSKPIGILRNLGGAMSLRTGKFGPYVFYKTEKMKTPKFFSLKKCPHPYDTCTEADLVSWVTDTFLSK